LTTALMSSELAYAYLAAFALVLVILTTTLSRRFGPATVDSFLVANRVVPWWIAGPSIAAGWTWAIALMVSVQEAYENGFAGIFWFTVPNVFAVLLYIWLGPKIRKVLPQGYSLPEWIHHRFSDARVTYLYIFVYFYYQIMACAVQVYAGGSLLSAATGINVFYLMPMVLAITLFYCIFSGLRASILTDLLQLTTLLTIGTLIVALLVRASGGQMSFSGVTKVGGINPFDYRILFTAGVIQSVGLLSGSIGDQPFWQRCLAVKQEEIKKSFIFGGLLFAAIPIGLSLLGFIAAAPSVALKLPQGFDTSLVGFAVVQQLLPPGIATLFVFLLLAALCSSLDSALVASSSLYRLLRVKPWRNEAARSFSVNEGRLAMVVTGLLGLIIGVLVKITPGFDLQYLWWLLNTIGACVALPTVLSLFWPRLTARGILIGSSTGLAIGLPLVVYSSVNGLNYLLAATYFGVVAISAAACVLTAAREERPFVPVVSPAMAGTPEALSAREH
jgi:SSS family transporter